MPKKRSRLEQRKWLKSEAKRQCLPLSLLKQRLKIDGDRKAKEGQEGEDGARTTEVGQDLVQVENGNNGLTPGEAEISPILSEDKHYTFEEGQREGLLREGGNDEALFREGGREGGVSLHNGGREGCRKGGGLLGEGVREGLLLREG